MGREWTGAVVLVENASPAHTSAAARAQLAESFPLAAVTSVVSRRNRGFAGGVNLGVARTRAPYVGVFNPDGATRPDTIARLVAALDLDPGALAAGACVLSGTATETPDAADPRVVDWLPGTATLYRRDAFLGLGGFDPGFFMYCEDVDLSRRAGEKGWRLLLVPDAIFDHDRSFNRIETLRRMHMWTVSNTKLVYQYAPSRRRALVRLARQRARWFRDLARSRRFWTLGGALLGSVAWSASLPRLERRRRHPWDSDGLRRWLADVDGGLQATE
jgi:GT2 family glycosyltransferase